MGVGVGGAGAGAGAGAEHDTIVTAEERQQVKEARRKKKEYLRKHQQKLVALRLSCHTGLHATASSYITRIYNERSN